MGLGTGDLGRRARPEGCETSRVAFRSAKVAGITSWIAMRDTVRSDPVRGFFGVERGLVHRLPDSTDRKTPCEKRPEGAKLVRATPWVTRPKTQGSPEGAAQPKIAFAKESKVTRVKRRPSKQSIFPLFRRETTTESTEDTEKGNRESNRQFSPRISNACQLLAEMPTPNPGPGYHRFFPLPLCPPCPLW